jgi:hypothetical protein
MKLKALWIYPAEPFLILQYLSIAYIGGIYC